MTLKGVLVFLLVFTLLLSLNVFAQPSGAEKSNFGTIQQGGSGTFEFKKGSTGITSLEISSPIEGVEDRGQVFAQTTFVNRIQEKKLLEQTQIIYTIISLSSIGLGARNIGSVEVIFELDPEWVARNEVDSDLMAVFIGVNSWSLASSAVKVSGNTYRATIPGLTTFAIAATSIAPLPTPVPTPTIPEVETSSNPPLPPDTPAPEIAAPDVVAAPEPSTVESVNKIRELPDPVTDKNNIVSLIVILIVAVGIVVLYIEFKHKGLSVHPNLAKKNTAKKTSNKKISASQKSLESVQQKPVKNYKSNQK